MLDLEKIQSLSKRRAHWINFRKISILIKSININAHYSHSILFNIKIL